MFCTQVSLVLEYFNVNQLVEIRLKLSVKNRFLAVKWLKCFEGQFSAIDCLCCQ